MTLLLISHGADDTTIRNENGATAFDMIGNNAYLTVGN